ncbi:tigger transposable element-derived protein 6-like [Schistocerca serialis cubense]|uniref:tigger transposable element-derived protein 6-like n=1 Tax=Schistocerca serialis cubense TaxID=2023355 RepID=UPI00214F5776|nr:tigger transposable element-derived protein 6-like [Schistocerca serialis cubense]
MGSAARKVLPFVDRCAAHPPDVPFLKNVKVIFLPPNCTSRLQPLDLGIIHALKVKYRTALVKKALNLMDQRKPGSQQSSQLKLNILQAINLIMYSWREVSAETIKNCFTKAGFCENEMAAPVEEVASDLQEFHQLIGSDSVTFEDFVAVDDNVATTGVQSIEELTAERSLESNSGSESDSDKEDDPVPSYTKAAEAFETFRRYMMAHRLEDRTVVQLAHLEQEMVAIESRKNRKQASLLEYFKKS